MGQLEVLNEMSKRGGAGLYFQLPTAPNKKVMLD